MSNEDRIKTKKKKNLCERTWQLNLNGNKNKNQGYPDTSNNDLISSPKTASLWFTAFLVNSANFSHECRFVDISKLVKWEVLLSDFLMEDQHVSMLQIFVFLALEQQMQLIRSLLTCIIFLIFYNRPCFLFPLSQSQGWYLEAGKFISLRHISFCWDCLLHLCLYPYGSHCSTKIGQYSLRRSSPPRT